MMTNEKNSLHGVRIWALRARLSNQRGENVKQETEKACVDNLRRH